MFLPIFKFYRFSSKNVNISVTDFLQGLLPQCFSKLSYLESRHSGESCLFTLSHVLFLPVLLPALPRTNASFHDWVSGLWKTIFEFFVKAVLILLGHLYY